MNTVSSENGSKGWLYFSTKVSLISSESGGLEILKQTQIIINHVSNSLMLYAELSHDITR